MAAIVGPVGPVVAGDHLQRDSTLHIVSLISYNILVDKRVSIYDFQRLVYNL